MESFIEFPNRSGKILRGMIHRPAGATARRPAPGVMFFHGFTGDRMESHWIFIKCARALERAGIASLRFDFYGSGESEGEFREMTLSGEISDAMAVVKFWRGQKGIDPERIGLCGLSMGGAVAVCVAGGARARTVVLWSAVAHTRIFRSLARQVARPAPGGKGRLEYDAREISPLFLADALETRPLEALARYRGPTLIIHGEKDESVPVSHAEDFFRISPAKIKEKSIVRGADHTYTSIAWEREVIERTVGWFGRFLAKTQSGQV